RKVSQFVLTGSPLSVNTLHLSPEVATWCPKFLCTSEAAVTGTEADAERCPVSGRSILWLKHIPSPVESIEENHFCALGREPQDEHVVMPEESRTSHGSTEHPKASPQEFRGPILVPGGTKRNDATQERKPSDQSQENSHQRAKRAKDKKQ